MTKTKTKTNVTESKAKNVTTTPKKKKRSKKAKAIRLTSAQEETAVYVETYLTKLGEATEGFAEACVDIKAFLPDKTVKLIGTLLERTMKLGERAVKQYKLECSKDFREEAKLEKAKAKIDKKRERLEKLMLQAADLEAQIADAS